MSDDVLYDDERCKRFNESLDEGGEVGIAGTSFIRSRILFEMDREYYKQALSDFEEQEFEELKQSVFDRYPACIAYNYRLSEKGEGATDPVRRLMHLKDTWEAIVFILYALVMGEVRHKKVILKAAQVFVSHGAGGNPVYANLNTDKLLSDAIKQRLQNIKGIIQFCKASSLGFKCEEDVDESLINDLLGLQDIRNDMSHLAVPTREQAKAELKQVEPLFRVMLTKTRFLEDLRILRFENFAMSCRCETFNGYSLNREFEEFPFTDPQRAFVLGLGQDQLFAVWDTECFSLSPFLHFERDTTGHESYVCFYKRRKDGKYWYEPVKVRDEKAFDHLQARFEAEKDVLVGLLVP